MRYVRAIGGGGVAAWRVDAGGKTGGEPRGEIRVQARIQARIQARWL